MLFLPTVFINSALWAQSDSIYTSFSLGGLYFLLRKKPFWSIISFGSIRIQTAGGFSLPPPLRSMDGWRNTFALLSASSSHLCSYYLSSLSVGRNFVDMLILYLSQVGYLSGSLSLGAPTLFQLIAVPKQQLLPWKDAGIILTLGVVLILSFVVLVSKRKITSEIILKLALVFALIVPFLLPEMHERYFYLADALSLVYAFYFPKYFYVPIVVQICSLESYMPFLMQTTVIGQPYLALLMAAIITVVLWEFMKTLWTPSPTSIFAWPTNSSAHSPIPSNTHEL